MQNDVKYVHTNLIAKDWEALAKFYIEVFGCKPIYPKRNLMGQWLDKITLLNKARIQGIHLQLPGYKDGPTLEIFEYISLTNLTNSNEQQRLNMPGFGHIAFHVTNVKAILNKVIKHGGKSFGKIVRKKYSELNSVLTITYAKDPEGNFIELQNWNKVV